MMNGLLLRMVLSVCMKHDLRLVDERCDYVNKLVFGISQLLNQILCQNLVCFDKVASFYLSLSFKFLLLLFKKVNLGLECRPFRLVFECV